MNAHPTGTAVMKYPPRMESFSMQAEFENYTQLTPT